MGRPVGNPTGTACRLLQQPLVSFVFTVSACIYFSFVRTAYLYVCNGMFHRLALFPSASHQYSNGCAAAQSANNINGTKGA